MCLTEGICCGIGSCQATGLSPDIENYMQAQPSSAAPYEEAAQSGTQTTTMGVEDTTTQPTAPAVMHLPLSADEANFIGTLNTQVRQFNEFFEDAGTILPMTMHAYFV